MNLIRTYSFAIEINLCVTRPQHDVATDIDLSDIVETTVWCMVVNIDCYFKTLVELIRTLILVYIM